MRISLRLAGIDAVVPNHEGDHRSLRRQFIELNHAPEIRKLAANPRNQVPHLECRLRVRLVDGERAGSGSRCRHVSSSRLRRRQNRYETTAVEYSIALGAS